MARPLPLPYPGIDEPPLITELRFPRAGVTVSGEFALNEFALLGGEQLEFLRIYIRTRGNLKEVERLLGVSYPTVRARFEALLRTLGYDAGSDPRDEVLEQLERGEIDPEEALRRIRR